jgi:hypothetical protein
MKAQAWICALLLGWAGSAQADEATNDRGTYLSAQFGGGRIDGGNAGGNRWMRSRAGELRIGRPLAGSTDSRMRSAAPSSRPQRVSSSWRPSRKVVFMLK